MVTLSNCRAMNPVNAEGNMFANLFDKVPAKRAGVPEDIAGAILYLVSKAGVCFFQRSILISRHTSTDDRYVWTEEEC
jgi:hypothetical protein